MKNANKYDTLDMAEKYGKDYLVAGLISFSISPSCFDLLGAAYQSDTSAYSESLKHFHAILQKHMIIFKGSENFLENEVIEMSLLPMFKLIGYVFVVDS